MQTDPNRWAPVWEGSTALVFAAEKILNEHAIPYARVEADKAGQVQLRVPWEEDEHAREMLRGNA